ncbi:hypothetical protein T484DRAFT_1789626 [Baffinella frigidus]|nr:hypothetical protein T484DRAFT_1789626 [Cryptophyta sp. CCMP2293]
MAVTLEATRGAFTNPDASGLTFTTGTGVKDQLIQTFLCRYPDCQRAISEVRYQSADEAGTDVITVTVDDRGNSGELGSQVASVAISLTLSSGPYNIPPTVDIPEWLQGPYTVCVVSG